MADKVRMGFIGVGNRGTQLLHGFMRNDDCEIAALCDVYTPYTTRNRDEVDEHYIASGKVPKMGEDFPHAKRYADFRELLQDEGIDAVCIATPDHWHAVQTIAAFRSGKDVFVEKPLTATIHEGRRMVEVARETGRVAGVCLNRRGSSVYRKCVEMVRGGRLGDVKAAYASHSSNMHPTGIGRAEAAQPPRDLDWDMWVGPRAERAYQYNLAHYYFRWWSDYSSQMGNWGVHYMDVIRWMTGETGPVAVTAIGTNSTVKDDRSIPDTMAVLFEMPGGMIIHFDVNEASAALRVQGGEVMLCGTKGSLAVNQDKYTITPSWPGQFQTWKAEGEVEEYEVKSDESFGDLGIKEDSTQILIDDFVKCVRTREQTLCPLEDGHRSTTFAHLANISLKLGRRLEWDAEAERVTNVPEANELLHYEYREPWTLEGDGSGMRSLVAAEGSQAD